MFDNFLGKNLMGKMGEMQKQVEIINQKLDIISVIGKTENGNVSVTANGNRLITNITITEEFKTNASAIVLQEAIIQATNNALEQAKQVEKAEMSRAAMGILPGLE